VLAKVFAALRDENVVKRDIAAQLHITSEEIEQLVFGLTLTGLSGPSAGASSGNKSGKLRIVGKDRG
jgi:hypothetical protein